MLVLTRKPHQEIVIGDDVVITVVQVNGDTVRLGVTAPRDTTVHRREVYDLILRAKLDEITGGGDEP
mgnify:CR=1 FL=1